MELYHKEDTANQFQEFLSHLRTSSRSEGDEGFRLAIRDFLRQSPEHDFADVWLWCDWPDLEACNFTKHDSGIDLVAREKQAGKLWAIQCKFYQEETPIERQDLDSFLATAHGKTFSERLIVTTTFKWDKNAKEVLFKEGKDCRVIGLTDLNDAPYDWFRRKAKAVVKKPYPHQRDAVANAQQHYRIHDRGQLIMACGTGKTYTSLQILETITSEQANILFLAPSISLVAQTLREYAYQSKISPRFIIVCSDHKVDKDSDGYKVADLPIPPTTNEKDLANVLQMSITGRTIVLCTYQSLKQVAVAQTLGAPEFDLTICDEAHRTTGVEGTARGGNYFTRINDKNYVKCKKRLYMTATPRLYHDTAKSKAQQEGVELCSMDDKASYGSEFYRLDFSEAIKRKLLSDYKVILLTIGQEYACEKLQRAVGKTKLTVDDAAKLVACYKALRDQGLTDSSGKKLSRAVGFVNSIKNSKAVKEGFAEVIECLDSQDQDGFICETEHIDGNDNSIERHRKLAWLKENAGYKNEKICRILMNAKCLTEGIDVPTLDACLFLQPRESQVDVIQAVGRVLRLAVDKDFGYIILPIVIPAGSNAVKELDNNKTYKVVWQVLNALKAHDNEFDTHINNLHLNKNKSDRIKVVDIGSEKVGQQPSISKVKNRWQDNLEELNQRLYTRVVEICGDRLYEDKWHKRIKEISDTVLARIDLLLKTNQAIKEKFASYLQGLQASINKDVTVDDAKQMLAQHLVTKPAFDTIFKGYIFSQHNRISQAMEKVLDSLDQYGFRNELADCEVFYHKISKRLATLDNSAGRQTVIKDLYGRFLVKAFPKISERLGIVYTPIEIVDFILRSVDYLLRQEFGKGLTDRGVNIFDPFVGSGSFLVRLLEIDGLINDEDLEYKYRQEIHGNEILLLPYYLTSVNIENAFQIRAGKHLSFNNLVLADSFVSKREARAINANNPFSENVFQRQHQNVADINVVVMNPPYSVGQKSENDANKNTTNPDLEQRIRETYTANTEATNKVKIMDSYVKAIRLSSDWLGDSDGIIGFVSNASLLTKASMQGLRRCLVDEFSSIHQFNLRGNLRRGKDLKKEGQSVFDGTRVHAVITFLVKKNNNRCAKIYYHDIGDYLNSREKLAKVASYSSVAGINWQQIIPDKHGDWVDQRDQDYENLPVLGDKKGGTGIFKLHSYGVQTGRDAWVYNHDPEVLAKNMFRTIEFYGSERQRLAAIELTMKNIDQYIERDPTNISWSHNVKNYLRQGKKVDFDSRQIQLASYRPFNKKHLYFCPIFNHSHYQTNKIFPIPNNRCLCVSGLGAKKFSVLMTNVIPDLNSLPAGTQCFPLYYLDNNKRHDGISNEALLKWQLHYRDDKISKEDMFYHFYAILHAKDYQEKYQNDLVKGLPRIPFVEDFWHFATAGRELAEVHVNYEQQLPLKGLTVLFHGIDTRVDDIPADDLLVSKKMKIAKDLKSIEYNNNISIVDIPEQAWQYKVNGYAPVKLVVERYYRKIDKKTNILDDPNKFSDDPRYILKLVLNTITVGVKTTELVRQLHLFSRDKAPA